MKHKREFPVNLMCKLLNVSRAGYYEFYGRKESLRSIRNKDLSVTIKEIFESSNTTYGSIKVHQSLLRQGKRFLRAKIARLMKSLQLRSV